MTRAQLEHLLRAAAIIADDDEIVVIGNPEILLRRLETVEVEPAIQRQARAAIERAFRGGTI